jgi:hypothetical protein
MADLPLEEVRRAVTLDGVPNTTVTTLRNCPVNPRARFMEIVRAARDLRACGLSPAGIALAIARHPLGRGLPKSDIEAVVLCALADAGEGEPA